MCLDKTEGGQWRVIIRLYGVGVMNAVMGKSDMILLDFAFLIAVGLFVPHVNIGEKYRDNSCKP
jgi:hypothetical protein